MQAKFFHGDPLMVDYTPSGDVAAGAVVVVGDMPQIAHLDIAANRKGALAAGGGVYQVAADGAIAAGKRVYWDDSANKVTLTATSNKSFGWTITAAATNGDLIYVEHAPAPGDAAIQSAAAVVAALTDNTTGVTGTTTLAAGVGVETLTIPLTSLATGLSTAAIDLLTEIIPGYRFKVLSFQFVTTVAGTGSGASQVFNLEIESTNVTGGVLTVTLASTDTIGKVTSGTAITANNTGTAAQKLSIEMASGGTVFTAGAGYFVIEIQNMDTADAVAGIAAKIAAILTSLKNAGLMATS